MIREREIELVGTEKTVPRKSDAFFYNRHMVLNRDISVCALEAFQGEREREENKKVGVCDCMSGSGIRALRYSLLANTEVTANDLNPKAVKAIKKNAKRNNLKINIKSEDANLLLSRGLYDVIDVDPYGTPMPYLDSAARGIFRRGMIMVTATDLAVLCGTYKKTCIRRYASMPLKNGFAHETGLRILIKAVAEAFARYDHAFKPVICFYYRHNYRVIGKVWKSKKGANRALRNVGYLVRCGKCGYRKLAGFDEICLNTESKRCVNCKSALEWAGPLWAHEVVDKRFLGATLKCAEKREYVEAVELLGKLEKERLISTPYYNMHEQAKMVGKNAPRISKFMEYLRKKGYLAERTHFSPLGVRTNSPVDEINAYIESLGT